MSRGFHFWHSHPLDRVMPRQMANPRPPTMSPEETSELNTKLGERGLMAGRNLSPYMSIPEAPMYTEHEETYKG